MQLGLDRARRLAHPEHHGGEDGGGGQADDRLEQLLLALRKFGTGQLQAGADEQRQGSSQHHADPDGGHPVSATGTLQVAGDDANDKRRFDAFAEHDQKGNEHESYHRHKRRGAKAPGGR